MKYPMIVGAALLMAGTAAYAEITPESVGEDFVARGFKNIEVRIGSTEIKAEGESGGVKVSETYDKESGDLVKSESEEMESSATEESDNQGAGDDDEIILEDEGGDDVGDNGEGGDHEGGDSEGGDGHGEGADD